SRFAGVRGGGAQIVQSCHLAQVSCFPRPARGTGGAQPFGRRTPDFPGEQRKFLRSYTPRPWERQSTRERGALMLSVAPVVTVRALQPERADWSSTAGLTTFSGREPVSQSATCRAVRERRL